MQPGSGVPVGVSVVKSMRVLLSLRCGWVGGGSCRRAAGAAAGVPLVGDLDRVGLGGLFQGEERVGAALAVPDAFDRASHLGVDLFDLCQQSELLARLAWETTPAQRHRLTGASPLYVALSEPYFTTAARMARCRRGGWALNQR